ncbi:lipoprotein [Candidatus Njordibacter sp. Uisw_039]
MKKIMCVLALSFALASCGQAGSLYVPDPEQTDAQSSN